MITTFPWLLSSGSYIVSYSLSSEEECKDAFIKFNGRWYAGRQLHCELCPVNRWKNAICGECL